MQQKWSKLMAEGKEKYKLVNIIAKRAREINEGARPLVPVEDADPTRAAVAELMADKLQVTIPDNKKEKSEK